MRLQLTAVPMAMMALAVCVASAASSQNTRVSAASGSCCWLDSTACPLPTHSCEIPACSYKLDADDSVAGLAAGTTCFTCHAVEGTKVGPSFTDLATKFAAMGEDKAEKALDQDVHAGVQGTPMPPNPTLSQAELDQIADWILSLKK